MIFTDFSYEINDFMNHFWTNNDFTMYARMLQTHDLMIVSMRNKILCACIGELAHEEPRAMKPKYDHDHVAEGSIIVRVASVRFSKLSVSYRSWWWRILHKHGNH